MAIKFRRGNYEDLDTSRLVQGEPFLTLDQVDGDYYAGIAIAPSNVIRLATWSNLVDIRDDCEGYAEDSEAWAVGQRDGTDVPSTDPTYENNSKYYAEEAEGYYEYVHEAAETHDPNFEINWTTGELTYSGGYFTFWIDDIGYIHWGVENP